MSVCRRPKTRKGKGADGCAVLPKKMRGAFAKWFKQEESPKTQGRFQQGRQPGGESVISSAGYCVHGRRLPEDEGRKWRVGKGNESRTERNLADNESQKGQKE